MKEKKELSTPWGNKSTRRGLIILEKEREA